MSLKYYIDYRRVIQTQVGRAPGLRETLQIKRFAEQSPHEEIAGYFCQAVAPQAGAVVSRTAFVHDNYVQAGGGEKVAEELARCLPDADLFSTVLVEERLAPYLRERRVRTTWMQRLPAMKRYYRHYFLLFPISARSLDLSRYDRIVSSCYGFAKMVRKPPGTIHVCYCHTPTRWIWRYDDYANREGFGTLTTLVLKRVIPLLKRMDVAAAQQVDYFIANSRAVADRIRACYGRESVVIHPPIQVNRFACSDEVDDYYLVVSRLAAYKRIDLAIEACERLGRRLKIVGDGLDRARLEKIAGQHTEICGRLPDTEVARLMSRCRAFLFPGEEDFGMAPLEASASGRPCIAYGRGGALDTVVPGLNGLHFSEPNAASLADAIERADAIAWDSRRIRAHAEQFDAAIFREKIQHALRNFGAESRTPQAVSSRLRRT